MDKYGARYLFKNILNNKNIEKSSPIPLHFVSAKPKSSGPAPTAYFGVFDLETQRSAKEGGANLELE